MTFKIYDIYCRVVAEVICCQVSEDDRRQYAENTGRRILGDQFLCIEAIGGDE